MLTGCTPWSLRVNLDSRRLVFMAEGPSPVKKQNLLSHERGSALVMVMFIVLLLTILGLSVLSATVGGAHRSEIRESDVQTLHLTEKSLEEAAAYITSGLNNKALNPAELKQTIETNIANLLKRDLSVTTDLDLAEGRISNITLDHSQNTDPLKFQLTITAQAKVNGVVRQLKRQLLVDANPDFLKYALGSEGDVTINGAPLIQGNLYAGKELRIRDQANYVYQGMSQPPVATIYPSVQPLGTGNEGEIHVQSLGSIKYAERGGAYNIISVPSTAVVPGDVSVEGNSIENENLHRILGLEWKADAETPVLPLDKVKIKKQQKFVQIDVKESFIDKLAEATGGSSRQELEDYFIAGNVSGAGFRIPSSFEQLHYVSKPEGPPDSEDPDYENKKKAYEIALKTYTDNLEKFYTLSSHAIFEGDLFVDGIEYENLLFTNIAKESAKWLIVRGDLIINNQSGKAMQVRGNILVTGDVLIKGEVNFDCTMFALGKATIDDAYIHGLGEKQLVLISKEDLLINRVDKFNSPAVETMDGFFYTEGQADVYGVGTSLNIKGGIFSKDNLTVNAVVGEVRQPMSPNSNTPLLFIGPEIPTEKRRLQITYDKSIYEAQKAGLPRVNQVKVTTGPITLEPLQP